MIVHKGDQSILLQWKTNLEMYLPGSFFYGVVGGVIAFFDDPKSVHQMVEICDRSDVRYHGGWSAVGYPSRYDPAGYLTELPGGLGHKATLASVV